MPIIIIIIKEKFSVVIVHFAIMFQRIVVVFVVVFSSSFFFFGGGGGGCKIYRDGKRRDRQTEIETVNGCFTPSQPVRLYQSERRTKKEREIRMCEKGGGGGNKT